MATFTNLSIAGTVGARTIGFTDEYPVSRFYRGARYGSIGGGTSETLRDLMGRKIVGDLDFDQGILGLGTY